MNAGDTRAELLVVMPVFNEQASVRRVVGEWFPALERHVENFTLLAIDDGSRDGTPALLREIAAERGGRFEVRTQKNRGHGQACLTGYREACARGVPFVFQIDSDGQCDPRYFARLWAMRTSHDVIYGWRARRDDGFRRVLAGHVLRGTIMGAAGVWCADPNVPYRLMRTEALSPFLEAIPPDFVLANVALAVLLRKSRAWRHGSVPIHFRARYGGEPSVRLARFGEKAAELVRQLRSLKGPAA